MSGPADSMHSADLPVLLRALSPSGCDRVAELIVELRGRSRSAVHGTYSAHSLASPEQRGHLLIPDIVADLRALGRHETGPAYGYQEILRGVAHRHGIGDDDIAAILDAANRIEPLASGRPSKRADEAAS